MREPFECKVLNCDCTVGRYIQPCNELGACRASIYHEVIWSPTDNCFERIARVPTASEVVEQKQREQAAFLEDDADATPAKQDEQARKTIVEATKEDNADEPTPKTRSNKKGKAKGVQGDSVS